ncbi:MULTISPECIES: HlyD family type I secretion periplasmic adaptor subunit [Vibrio harveyi group]|uniref:HlyD family type I secretion periplasmic adaptor subunit n=1 Tax=Vibrio harveyi group TaxID=717610 RepID=UPI0004249C9A|nr:HlyD family type I secretion periplasmic adaptor subunit [Vibrio parahaemolyticus]EGQ8180923.1 HlyD family type I secretion periplasmic adaptor subunit [Vibrio parahaemolyticus]EGR0398525.1 HlyD family type I secretion periplasmic adaptor subunit [Vibrio parahaemolyticus]EGR1755318.1 HlyD family type I secretion periplasmic adaptor subunit [Vibrio parahaemolyticus]EGR3416501.1 HlyD family type I secretion periplasmic adaptor subunit [Vibrio parahaemolyticus]EIW7861645.1 HlyD family type I s
MSGVRWSNAHLAYRSRSLIWLSLVLVLCVIVWASWAKLDEVVVGEGKVVPTLSVQTIQSLEGGILKELLVSPGEAVKRGQTIAVLDDTRFKSNYSETTEQVESLLAQKQRLQAELQTVKVKSVQLDWKEQVVIDPQAFEVTEASHFAFENARANYLERIGQLESELEEARLRIEQQSQAYADTLNTIKTLKSSRTIVVKERNMLREVVASGAVAEVELLKLNRDLIKLEGDIAGSQAAAQKQKAVYSESIADYRGIALSFRTESQGQLNEVISKLAQLNESRHAIADQLNRTQLLSPVDGTIKDIFLRSIGGVVKPGEPIMEIVPRNSALIVEARISPQNIAFIKAGLPATVKFSAYDFVIYGGLKGKVSYVSADALQTEEGKAYYRANIIFNNDDKFAIIPGMQVVVDIMTGEKTVLNYWLKPILRAKENALRER